jgi:zinc protease
MAFHAGAAGDPETLAMNMLLNILVGGDSSRLHRLLVEDEQLAIDVGAFQDEGFDPGVVYLYMTLPPDGHPAAVEARVLEALADVAANGVSAAELSKARNIMLADFWNGMATIDSKASALGNFAVFNGGFERLFTLTDDIEQTGNEELREVAAQVFRADNATIGVLLPAPEPASGVESAAGESAE